MDEPPKLLLFSKLTKKSYFLIQNLIQFSGYFSLPVMRFRKFYFSYKSDESEFGINGKGTGGTVSGWQSSGFESEAKYLYLNELNLIFGFSRWTMLTTVSASNTTELIIVNTIFGKLLFVLSAFVGIGGLDGTQNDSRKEINYSLIRIVCNPFWCCQGPVVTLRLLIFFTLKNQIGSRVMWIRLYTSSTVYANHSFTNIKMIHYLEHPAIVGESW